MLIHQNSNSLGNYNYNAFIYDSCEWYYHFHNNYELIYVISGDITANIDTHSENLTTGDFALILPNQIHSYRTPKNSRVWIGVFSEDFVFAFSSKISKKIGKQAKFRCDDAIREYVLHLLLEVDTRDIYLLKSCFYAICDQYQKNTEFISKESDSSNLLCKIVDYVSNNFKLNITLRQMAYDLGFEYHYLSRKFSEIFGTNFCQFVNRYRVSYANELLSQNAGSISEIAFDSGFQCVRSFNSNYKKIYGCVPSEHYGKF